jgi:cell division transport system permease protein
MSFFTSTKRLMANTSKQVRRSGWLAGGSVIVMTLAFFIGTIFLFLAYSSNLFLQSIENKPHIYLFFNAGTSEEKIFSLRDELNQLPEIYHIEYTNEESAYNEFKLVQERKDPQLAQSIRSNVLPPSLGIRLNKITDADMMIDLLNTKKDVNKDILDVRYSKETIDMFKNLFYWLRIGGGVIIGVLVFVIFLFTLLTVEFRTYNRAEEISIMQLVGGSLWFIRAPFILEGAFYGFAGSLVSNSIIFGLGYLVFGLNKTSAEVAYISNLLADLNWPIFSPVHYIAGFIGIILIGTIIGALNSLFAIRRYIY